MNELIEQSELPTFIEKNGEVLIRMTHEVVIENGVAVVRDLPDSTVYMNDEEYKKWSADIKQKLSGRA